MARKKIDKNEEDYSEELEYEIDDDLNEATDYDDSEEFFNEILMEKEDSPTERKKNLKKEFYVKRR